MWQLAGTSAVWTSPELFARVDLLHPEAGLHDVRVREQPLSGASFLRVETQHAGKGKESLLDAYVRGCDLIATFAQTPARPIRPQIYWRALAHENGQQLGGLELIVSTQTSLLDADTSLTTWSCVPAGEVLQLRDHLAAQFSRLISLPTEVTTENGPGLFLFRPPHADWSYVEMVYPTDFAAARLLAEEGATGLVRLTNTLFAERLEKGVIRRGRIRGVFLARSGDESAALAVYDSFVASPLPLTT